MAAGGRACSLTTVQCGATWTTHLSYNDFFNTLGCSPKLDFRSTKFVFWAFSEVHIQDPE